MHAGLFFRSNRDAVPGAVFHIVFYRVEDRPGSVLPGGRVQGDVHACYDVGEAVHLEIHGRSPDDGAAIIPADKIDIRSCGIDLAGHSGSPQVGFRPPCLTPVFQMVSALAVTAEGFFQGVTVFPVPVEKLLAGRDFVRIHRRDGISLLIVYGVVIPDKAEICFLKGEFLFSEVIPCKSSPEVPQVLCGQLFPRGTGNLRPAGASGGILVRIPCFPAWGIIRKKRVRDFAVPPVLSQVFIEVRHFCTGLFFDAQKDLTALLCVVDRRFVCDGVLDQGPGFIPETEGCFAGFTAPYRTSDIRGKGVASFFDPVGKCLK